jgi:hypothetical protein
MRDKYLFSIEVEPYHPNRQCSIINSNGGVPRHHFPIDRTEGVLVAMFSFEDVTALQSEYDWVKDVQKGYYEVRNEFET